jgi:N-methylhydantoinase A/oxoprolinase/acetone carboxylase beta subunit
VSAAGDASPARHRPVRVGIDVGGTFTKAVAIVPGDAHPLAEAIHPTTHHAPGGVSEGVAEVVRMLVARLGETGHGIELVAFSTTQAMNALLEGDVAPVGVVGIGAAPDAKRARQRTKVGEIALAPGRTLRTEHVFIDATGGLAVAPVDAAIEALLRAGCTALAVSGAFAVDTPEHEELVAQRARARGLPTCAGHELTGTYGLETRTVTAAINASILPLVERTAAIVEGALAEAGLEAPLLVLRGDGGAMNLHAFRTAPTMTIGSGPAAGVAAALHQLALRAGLVVECGGTSSNISVVRDGRTVQRSLRVMGRPTAIRAIDSWVVGAAGGSMARLGRRKVAEVGPRSAHVAGLPYACFATADELQGCAIELIAPREGDPAAYATVRAGERRYALTATCAANGLGLVEPGDYAAGDRAAALAGFEALGRQLRCSGEAAARAVLDGAVLKIADAVTQAARTHDLPKDAPVVALGGSGGVLAAEVARRLGRPLLRPDHPEVLSSIGAALSLVRAEAVRTSTAAGTAIRVARDAELGCIAGGAAANTVSVETSFDPRTGETRAVATGAIALQAGASSALQCGDDELARVAADALHVDPGALRLVAVTDFYRVFAGPGDGAVSVVDLRGAISFADETRSVIAADADAMLVQLRDAVHAGSLHLGVATMIPRVILICGPSILDLSDARRPEDVLSAAEAALAERPGPAVAAVLR